MKQVVALTGATGFIGQALCRRLLAAGHTVRALARKPHGLPPHPALQVIPGSVEDRATLDTLATGAAALIYCAGTVRGRHLQDFRPANVDGLRRLLEVMRSRNSKARLLYISSLVAREPGLSWYAASKWEGEQVLHREGSGLDWTIFRPPAVYGEGDRELLPLFRLMARGVALVPGDAAARVSLIHIDDLVAATEAWLDTAIAPHQTFCLADPEAAGYSWAQVANIASQYFGRKVRVMHLPRILLDAFATTNQKAAAVLGYAPMLTPAKLRELRHPDWVCDSGAFAAVSSWRPHVDLARGLALTLPHPGCTTRKAA